MKCTLLMAILLSGNIGHTSQNTMSHIFSANPSHFKPYKNSEIWAPGIPFQWNGTNISVSQAPENFQQKLWELRHPPLEASALATSTPFTSAFYLSSFSCPPLQFPKEDCSKVGSFPLLQPSQTKKKSTTLFILEPLYHLLWWGFGE